MDARADTLGADIRIGREAGVGEAKRPRNRNAADDGYGDGDDDEDDENNDDDGGEQYTGGSVRLQGTRPDQFASLPGHLEYFPKALLFLPGRFVYISAVFASPPGHLTYFSEAPTSQSDHLAFFLSLLRLALAR